MEKQICNETVLLNTSILEQCIEFICQDVFHIIPPKKIEDTNDLYLFTFQEYKA